MGRAQVCASIVVLLAWASTTLAVVFATVPVGNPGNAADTRYDTSGYGRVDYTYDVAKYEVTTGQYCEFLNSVAQTDTYALYSEHMAYEAPGLYGCNIRRTGSPGSYAYEVAPEWANRPVNWVSWGDAARFCNWLTNGQPRGVQDATTTEDGSYGLHGVTSDAELLAVTRRATAKWVIPTEDEWYKAAYHDSSKPGGPGYWDYPTRSDSMPSNLLSETGINNANFYDENQIGASVWTIGGPYYRTEVGAFIGAPSAYGTFDQGGNVWEWNEGIVDIHNRGIRGASFDYSTSYESGLGYYMNAGTRAGNTPAIEFYSVGFRVVHVPEPSTLVPLALTLGTILRRNGR